MNTLHEQSMKGTSRVMRLVGNVEARKSVAEGVQEIPLMVPCFTIHYSVNGLPWLCDLMMMMMIVYLEKHLWVIFQKLFSFSYNECKREGEALVVIFVSSCFRGYAVRRASSACISWWWYFFLEAREGYTC